MFADSVNASSSIGAVGSALMLNAHWVKAVLINTDLDKRVSGQLPSTTHSVLDESQQIRRVGNSRGGHMLTWAYPEHELGLAMNSVKVKMTAERLLAKGAEDLVDIHRRKILTSSQNQMDSS